MVTLGGGSGIEGEAHGSSSRAVATGFELLNSFAEVAFGPTGRMTQLYRLREQSSGCMSPDGRLGYAKLFGDLAVSQKSVGHVQFLMS